MKEDGGSAFPVKGYVCGAGALSLHGGMSLRDWFAGMALNGLLSCTQQPGVTFEQYASDSYTLADVMLKERGKE